MSVPVEERARSRMSGLPVRGWMRLFRIEMKRSPAILASILIAALSAWVMWKSLPVGVVRWREVSDSAKDPMIVVSAIAAGIGAYVARRDDRLRLGDQVGQTSLGQSRRDVLALLATVAWCLIGYLLVVGGFFIHAVMNATWGGPTWSFVYLTVATVILGVALGWLVGTVFRHRLSAVVAVSVTLAIHGFYPLTSRFKVVELVQADGSTNSWMEQGWYKNLLPYEMLDFFDLPSFTRLGALWILAIALLFAAAAWWWRYRDALFITVAVLAVVVAGIAGTGLVQKAPVDWTYREAVAYVDPVCDVRLEGQIEVCLHPKDEALLDEAADAVERLIAPVAGIDGVPTRFENQPASVVSEDPGRIHFHIHDATSIPNTLYDSLLRNLIDDYGSDFGYAHGAAKYVVLSWLLQEAGIDRVDGYQGVSMFQMPLPMVYADEIAIRQGIADPMARSQRRFDFSREELAAFEVDVNSAIARFTALSPGEQRAWLEANWEALRSGELTLEDLP